ncbi:transmembrane protein 207 [Mustela putorius furo]|uniref:Transmembrane protein 207 n=1 Tax=Mustela putorius furo TaxID=9669 RepID=A0A8U0SJS2_MUSPF|nr:transmembrane protein 207 [Mustela putorius furo]
MSDSIQLKVKNIAAVAVSRVGGTQHFGTQNIEYIQAVPPIIIRSQSWLFLFPVVGLHGSKTHSPQPDHLGVNPNSATCSFVILGKLLHARIFPIVLAIQRSGINSSSFTTRCINYKDRYTRDWYIWFLLLIFLMTLLCGVMFFCLQCWLRRPRMESPSRTMAVFAVGDLDPVYGTEVAVTPTVGIHLQTPNPEMCPAPCFGTLDPPPPYEEILKSSR